LKKRSASLPDVFDERFENQQGLPVAGTWAGLKLYDKLDEAQFRKVVLVLLLVSGVALLLR
jgi:hypothetical protein